MAETCTVTLDKHRARRYFIILAGASLIGSWVIWLVLGFMGSHASDEGVAVADLIRTTIYSLPIGILLALVFPVMIRSEKHKKWLATIDGIQVYDKGNLITTCKWENLDDIIFREYSVGICLKNHVPSEFNIALPSEEVCDELSELYNRAKGTFCNMDTHTSAKV